MASYLARRLLQLVPLLFLISLFAFMLIRLGGDPMSMYGLNPNLTAEDRERIISSMAGTNRCSVQYLYWLRDVAQGDWGSSLYTYEPVDDMILARLPNTLILMGTVFVVTLVVADPARRSTRPLRQYSRLDYLITGVAFLAFALPTFWLGLVCIMVFSVKFKQWGLPYLPAGGMYDLRRGSQRCRAAATT